MLSWSQSELRPYRDATEPECIRTRRGCVSQTMMHVFNASVWALDRTFLAWLLLCLRADKCHTTQAAFRTERKDTRGEGAEGPPVGCYQALAGTLAHACTCMPGPSTRDKAHPNPAPTCAATAPAATPSAACHHLLTTSRHHIRQDKPEVYDIISNPSGDNRPLYERCVCTVYSCQCVAPCPEISDPAWYTYACTSRLRPTGSRHTLLVGLEAARIVPSMNNP